MLTSYIVLLVVACSIASPTPQLGGKIVGGSDANIKDFPYQLQLVLYGQHSCGASIISKFWALTAAHCVDGTSTSSLSLRAGATEVNRGGRDYKVIKSIVHEKYGNMDYDIALLKVSKAFVLSPSVQPIRLPAQDSKVQPGVNAVVTGWGYLWPGSGIISDVLQQVVVPIISSMSCIHAYDNLTDRMICAGVPAGGKDACQGDSGGPMAVNGTLVGIVSWGRGCALPEYPGVYTCVAELRDWIKQNSGV